MTAAWKLIEEARANITWYGCAAHVINLLSGDFHKLERVQSILEANKTISKFFKSHNILRELLYTETQTKYGVALGVVIDCLTRWSADYFKLRCNLRIKVALVAVTVNERMSREFRTDNNMQVK